MKQSPIFTVLGLGPSGTVAAHRAAQRGLEVVGIDPRGVNAPSTVGLWASQLPRWFPREAVASRFRPALITPAGTRILTSEYVVLSPGWEQVLDGFEVVREKAWPGVGMKYSLSFDGNRENPTIQQRISALKSWFRPNPDEQVSVILDESSSPGQLSHLLVSVPQVTMKAHQVAYGMVVPENAVPDTQRQGVLMDFSPLPGYTDSNPVTFSYRIPLGDGTWLIEETILATTGDPATLLPHLEEKNSDRLQHLGISGEHILRSEVVVFPLGPRRLPDDRPRTRLGLALSMIPFLKGAWLDLRFLAGPWNGRGIPGEAHIGGTAGWIHPATGYSVGTVLAHTDAMLDRVLNGETPTPKSWRINHLLRTLGLNIILRLSASQYREFFTIVLGLPEKDLLDYLTCTNPWVTARVMVRIILREFRSSPSTALAVFRHLPAALIKKP